MREQSGVANLTGESLAADAARSGAESTQAATSDYIDRIQSTNNPTAAQPGIPGAGGLTNMALGNLAQNNTISNPPVNTNTNAGAANTAAGQEDISPEGLLQVISQEW